MFLWQQPPCWLSPGRDTPSSLGVYPRQHWESHGMAAFSSSVLTLRARLQALKLGVRNRSRAEITSSH